MNRATRILTVSDGIEITARAVIIATGASYRRLDVPDSERLTGAGIFYATPAVANVVKGRAVFIAGGGNAAGQAVLFFAVGGAGKVTLLVRGDSLERGMSDYLIQSIRRLHNVEVRLRTRVVGVAGERSLKCLTLRDDVSGKEETHPAHALFVMIGADPRTEWLSGAVQRDPKGFILTGRAINRAKALWNLDRAPTRLETSIPGVFAAGDVRQGSVKRVASAVGEGAVAVQYVHEYLAGRYSLGTGIFNLTDLNIALPKP